MATSDIHKFGELKKVGVIREKDYSDAIVEIFFEFQHIALLLSVDEEDNIIFKESVLPENFVEEDRFKFLYNKQLSWVWKLTNQQGYTDGIQFEFTNKGEGYQSREIIQFLAVASTLKHFKILSNELE